MRNAILQPEQDVLLCCARSALDTGSRLRLASLLRNVVDWDYLFRTSQRHGLLLLLHKHLIACGSTAIPPSVLQRIKDHFHRNAARNLHMTAELCRVLDYLEGHGVSALPWKGPALSASLYEDLTARQYDDLDVLIRVEEVPRALQLLQRIGYQPQFSLGGAEEEAYLRSKCEYALVEPQKAVVLEIHWRIVPRYFSIDLDIAPLWERTDAITLGNSRVQTLKNEDLMILLAIHGASHLWDRVGWICDLSELLAPAHSLDWDWILRETKRLGCRRILMLGLNLASQLLGQQIPDQIEGHVQERSATRLAETARRRLFRDHWEQPGIVEVNYFLVRSRERWMDRVLFCIRLATTTSPEDWAFLRLPRLLFPLYVFVRPFRLCIKYFSSYWRQSGWGTDGSNA